MKQLLNVFRVYENRYLKKINTIDISDFTDKQVAHTTKLIDDAPGKVWEYQLAGQKKEKIVSQTVS